jgi:hypothetical protein
VNPQNSTGI